MTWEHSSEVVEVARVFDRVARQLLESHDMGVTLEHIVHLAVETLDACEFAGISYVEKRTITSPASSNDVPRVLDELQSETGEGPCLDAIRDHAVFKTGDLATEQRWPHFAARAYRQTGVTSILSMRLFAEEDTMGCLNLYSTRRDAFNDTDIALASVFATHAAVAMDSAKREQGLQARADTRDLIGQAKGVIMSSIGCSADAAFGLIVRQSQHENRKVVDVAAEIAARASRQSDSGTGDRTRRPTAS